MKLNCMELNPYSNYIELKWLRRWATAESKRCVFTLPFVGNGVKGLDVTPLQMKKINTKDTGISSTHMHVLIISASSSLCSLRCLWQIRQCHFRPNAVALDICWWWWHPDDDGEDVCGACWVNLTFSSLPDDIDDKRALSSVMDYAKYIERKAEDKAFLA